MNRADTHNSISSKECQIPIWVVKTSKRRRLDNTMYNFSWARDVHRYWYMLR